MPNVEKSAPSFSAVVMRREARTIVINLYGVSWISVCCLKHLLGLNRPGSATASGWTETYTLRHALIRLTRQIQKPLSKDGSRSCVSVFREKGHGES
jgi:hypothetical protein